MEGGDGGRGWRVGMEGYIMTTERKEAGGHPDVDGEGSGLIVNPKLQQWLQSLGTPAMPSIAGSTFQGF